MTPDILYEDKELIVCRKPAGTPTQSSRIGTPDMVSILKNHLRTSGKKNQPPYLAVIHRLDQPVEGLLIFAKTPAAAKQLNRQLQSSGFGKHYRALLHTVPAQLEGDLQDYMVKDGRTNTSRICSADTPGAKSARLHYRILKQIGGYAIAEITLDTGRHHQIRVQMAHLGCPIAGDRKYGPAEQKEALYSKHTMSSADAAVRYEKTNAESVLSETGGLFSSPASQLQLFAYRLSFRHPTTGKYMEFTLS